MVKANTNGHVDLTKKTVGLMVSFSKLGNRRKVSTSQVEVDADKDLISVSKKLIDAPELDAIRKHMNQSYSRLQSWALPSMLREGIYLIPNAAVPEVDKQLQKDVAELTILVDKFGVVYADEVKKSKKRLRGLSDSTDYPPVETLKSAFSITWQYISFSTPVSLQEIDAEIYEEQKKKAQKVWEETEETIRQLLRAELDGLLGHLVERLTPEKDGKKKIFRDSAVTNIKDFIDLCPIRNVTDDDDLKKFVAQTKQLVAKADPEVLRTSEANRDAVRDGFKKIKTQLAKLIVNQPARMISSDDDV